MESLLANYASSDEEEEQQSQKPIPVLDVPPKTTSSSSKGSSLLFSSLPQPKSSSVFQSLPQPKRAFINPSPAPPLSPTATDDMDTRAGASSKFSERTSLFSSLPKPKSQISEQPKKIVQFKPPIIPLPKSIQLDDEDDAEEEENKTRKSESSSQAPPVKPLLSSILPAPRYSATLGVQASSGSGRRSIIETEAQESAPASNSSSYAAESNVADDANAGNYVNYDSYTNYQYGTAQNPQNPGYFVDHAGYGDYSSGIDQSVGVQPEDAFANYSTFGDYGQYGNKWVDGSAASAPEASRISDNVVKLPGKRGRHEIPSEVIEVKQEELTKNRPREDQVKLTGIAFGPAYQPVSTKGKPSKLHKRKHQIGSLYFDMKQNETVLAERRAKGMLTKAETQAKYGW